MDTSQIVEATTQATPINQDMKQGYTERNQAKPQMQITPVPLAQAQEQ
jgi:hypothetical protein